MASPEYSLAVLNERGKTHGDYNEVSETFVGVINALGDNVTLEPNHIAAMHMIAMKLARIANGNPNEKDHWDDIAGYAKLVSENLS